MKSITTLTPAFKFQLVLLGIFFLGFIQLFLFNSNILFLLGIIAELLLGATQILHSYGEFRARKTAFHLIFFLVSFSYAFFAIWMVYCNLAQMLYMNDFGTTLFWFMFLVGAPFCSALFYILYNNRSFFKSDKAVEPVRDILDDSSFKNPKKELL